ncbi:MAG: radical SAM protein [Candidatus Omnitrophica bacterium CG11_big_fil_rev_8_21_14_0_20_45_26]|uniref:Radical SAM protein n=1 Tax=Candidatus Abzuiibacterium crystallinum TaxID=1974748 RepID=A0A2H0LPU3_9BACT|nr:MAG: radical SAM protein [Candidatus Omnitrophica bacterium CG11_big_fil_rev_8_21_14_0_20_45_26]PIW63587.1 MAG: radical SAM protein [Candidatus Omnitrophica bacterium CG12_big_fil_rev_8_21_14_0_65_45_16]
MIKKLNLFLIKPSKYDDDGYVIRYWKGVLPSNTLACLYGLSEDVRKRKILGSQLKWRIEAIDETVQKVPIAGIITSSRRNDSRTIVCLVGVQSNQFPRAKDLALMFREANVDVLIGGFHVSGVLAFNTLPQEISELIKMGVIVVAGEVEDRWGMILKDILNGTSKPVYNFLSSPPDLTNAPLPKIPENLMNRYAVGRFATLDCGRGCPFQCSFCTVINVQGRLMRYRLVDSILNLIRENFSRHKIAGYFFTDDNFSRNKNWEAIFDGLIRLREEENIPVSFMIQVDTLSHRIPNFVNKASRAGCTQVFIGMESINEENLKAAGKRQNKVSDFKNLVQTYHNQNIITHLAYIIGFPFDDSASVRNNLAYLQVELGAEQASFFMLTPLPGSMDYQTFVSRGKAIDADLNNFDTFHETFRHSRMNPNEWTHVYNEAWSNFYGVENMKRILKNTPAKNYWGVFLKFIWYKNAIQVEDGHPMLHGFIRLKTRRERRLFYPAVRPWQYFKQRVGNLWQTLIGWRNLALEMEEVWLATRHRSLLEEKVLCELERIQKKVTEWRSLRVSELQDLYRRAALNLAKSQSLKAGSNIRIPSRLQLWFKKWDVFSDSLTFTRLPTKRFWSEVRTCVRKGRIHQIHFGQVVFTAYRECVLFLRFLFSLIKPIFSSW